MRRPSLFSAIQLVLALTLALAPLVLLLLNAAGDRLTANPIQELERQTGKAAYLLLLLSLGVTPVARVLRLARLTPRGWGPERLSPLRRVLGWAVLGWAGVHVLVFVGLDYAFDPSLLWDAVAEKRFALVGLAALVLLLARGVLPLALGRRDGGVGGGTGLRSLLAWLTPAAAVLVTIHYWWSVKAITTTEIGYALLTALVLGSWLLARVAPWREKVEADS